MTEQEKLEKVINGLECCLPPHDPNCDICPYDSIDLRCRAKLRDDIIALLKAQEPVEPVVDKNTSTGECEDPWGRLFFCGACGKRINEKYDPDEDDKYCKHCGQAVKWE